MNCPHCGISGGECTDWFNCQRRQIAALKAIVDKLPRTADGVPITPGMEVWQIDPSGFINAPPGSDSSDQNPRPWSCKFKMEGNCFWVVSLPVYSTREAAEAAKGANS